MDVQLGGAAAPARRRGPAISRLRDRAGRALASGQPPRLPPPASSAPGQRRPRRRCFTNHPRRAPDIGPRGSPVPPGGKRGCGSGPPSLWGGPQPCSTYEMRGKQPSTRGAPQAGLTVHQGRGAVLPRCRFRPSHVAHPTHRGFGIGHRAHASRVPPAPPACSSRRLSHWAAQTFRHMHKVCLSTLQSIVATILIF